LNIIIIIIIFLVFSFFVNAVVVVVVVVVFFFLFNLFIYLFLPVIPYSNCPVLPCILCEPLSQLASVCLHKYTILFDKVCFDGNLEFKFTKNRFLNCNVVVITNRVCSFN
jgi:hypothetical protein